MADTAARTANQLPAAGAAAPDAADLGQLILASIERIREQVRLEQACQRSAAPQTPTGR